MSVSVTHLSSLQHNALFVRYQYTLHKNFQSTTYISTFQASPLFLFPRLAGQLAKMYSCSSDRGAVLPRGVRWAASALQHILWDSTSITNCMGKSQFALGYCSKSLPLWGIIKTLLLLLKHIYIFFSYIYMNTCIYACIEMLGGSAKYPFQPQLAYDLLFLLVSVGSSTSQGLFGSGLGCRFWNVARWEGFSDLSHGLSLNLVSISDTSCGLEQRSEREAARLHIRLHEDSHVAIFFFFLLPVHFEYYWVIDGDWKVLTYTHL